VSVGGEAASAPPPAAGTPRFTVVVPTFNRCALVVEHVRALAQQNFAGGFEVVVVVDGSTDGTAAALAELALPFPLHVIEQPNRGAAAARNRGAREAHGELLLFLDDDMEAEPEMLAVHDRRHREGADAVVGHMPLHPRSPRHFLARASAAWVEHRRATLSGRTDPLPGSNLLTGQVSMARRRFAELGGFDESFNLGGAYGREDTDLGLRLEAAGGRLAYDPQAISHQVYEVTLRRNLARWRQVGRASVALVRKHPFMPEFVVRQGWRLGLFDRWVGRWLSRLVAPPLLALLESGREPRRLTRLFFWLQHHQYYRGVRDAGGYPRRRPLRVLAYHALRDLGGAGALARFGIPPGELCRQLRRLHRCGARFITADELLNYLHHGAGLPRRPVLLTFDDAYAELADEGLAVLRELAAPAVVFAVSGRVGGVNDWDAKAGAPSLALCDADGLRRLAAGGVEIGSHGRSHLALDRLEPARLGEELEGSAAELAALGLPTPRLLAYPFGRADEPARVAARRAGYAAAFTARPGRVTPASDPFALPRVVCCSSFVTI